MPDREAGTSQTMLNKLQYKKKKILIIRKKVLKEYRYLPSFASNSDEFCRYILIYIYKVYLVMNKINFKKHIRHFTFISLS